MPFSSIYAIHKSSNKGHFHILHDLQKMSPVATTDYVHCYKHMKQNSPWVRFKRPRWRATHLYKNPWKMSLCWGKNAPVNLASSHFLSRIKFIHLFKYKIWRKEGERETERAMKAIYIRELLWEEVAAGWKCQRKTQNKVGFQLFVPFLLT